MIKRETYMSRIRPFMNNDLIEVLTGIRRSGKSVMLELIKEELIDSGVSREQFISINFEDMRYSKLHTANTLHEEVLKRAEDIQGKVYLFFDEIQEVEEWEKCMNSLRVILDCDIYLTGSNAKLLSGELATYLGGRYVEFVIYPFSYIEFLELYHTVCPEVSEQQAFQKYMLSGGMPYLSNVKFLKNEQRTVSADTILNYIKYCVDAYLFYQVKRQDLQGKQILSTNEKYYIADHGIREAVYGGNMRDINLILENIVFMEILRRGYHVTVGKVKEKEIDFVCEKRNEKIYVQVTYLLASEDTINREFGIYENIKDNYPKFVVSLDEFDMSRNGIKHMNIREFLKAENWG